MVEAGGEREAAFERDEAVRRLEADDFAAGGRDGARAPGGGAEGGRGEPGGGGAGGPAARPAGDPSGRDRVRDGAEVGVLGGRPVGELVEVRLADVRVAALLEAGDDLR